MCCALRGSIFLFLYQITTVALKEYAIHHSDIYHNTHSVLPATIADKDDKPLIEMVVVSYTTPSTLSANQLSSCRVPLHHLRYTSHCDLRVYRGCSDPSLELVTLIKGKVEGGVV